MTLQNVLIVSLATLLLGLGIGYGTRSYIAEKQRLGHEVAEQKARLAEQTAYLDKIEQRDARNQQLQDQLTTLDTEKTNALNQALTTNSALRGDLAVAQRMRLNGTSCPSSGTPGGQASSAGSLGDGPGIELSEQTRHAVFDLRGDLVSDRAKLDYLQWYLREVGLSPPLLQ